jgi:hypothetical protein
MPILKFLLTNPALRLHIEEGVETSSLWFDATIERPHDFTARFTIFCDGKEYDAYSLKCEAILRQVSSQNESKQSPPPDPNDTFGIEEKPDCIAIACPPPDCKDADKFEPFFSIYLALPTNTFQLVLQANPETRLVHLWIDTTLSREEGLVYGDSLDGDELKWRVEKKNYARAKAITLQSHALKSLLRTLKA